MKSLVKSFFAVSIILLCNMMDTFFWNCLVKIKLACISHKIKYPKTCNSERILSNLPLRSDLYTVQESDNYIPTQDWKLSVPIHFQSLMKQKQTRDCLSGNYCDGLEMYNGKYKMKQQMFRGTFWPSTLKSSFKYIFRVKTNSSSKFPSCASSKNMAK